MLHLIVGHRGVGKTAFLARVRVAYEHASRPVLTWDLDEELARLHGCSVSSLFAQHGEAAFRQHEHATLRALLAALPDPTNSADVYVSVGAGYDEDPRRAVPTTWLSRTRVLWLRRLTDSLGRVFVDAARPRLDPDLSPLAESLRRYNDRQPRYHAWHDNVWIMPEGSHEDGSPAEQLFIASALMGESQPPAALRPAALTLLPSALARADVTEDFLARRRSWPGLHVELRDDLLSDAQLTKARSLIPNDRLILSARRELPPTDVLRRYCQQNILVDIPLELLQTAAGAQWLRDGLAYAGSRQQTSLIVSLHERHSGETVASAADRLQREGQRLGAQHYKLSVEVEDFEQLAAGVAWSQHDPSRHLFLPRTIVADPGAERWRWFRAVQMWRLGLPLSFVREGDGSSLDQPTLCEAWQLAACGSPPGTLTFAAVLGDPVQHSRSPSEHRAFFARHGLPVFAIPCRESDLAQGALATLHALGLRFAAVTAPLKRAVGALTGLASCNTLWWQDDQATWCGANTDPQGLQALLATLPHDADVAVWGGGGVLPSIHAVLPRARAFALRTGAERSNPSACDQPPTPASYQPSFVLWAAGHHSRDAAMQPPSSWRPACVYDLDYREDSAAREYALRVGARYVCGLTMFRTQAAAQREIWQRVLQASRR